MTWEEPERELAEAQQVELRWSKEKIWFYLLTVSKFCKTQEFFLVGGVTYTCLASWPLLWLGEAGQESCSSDEEWTSWSLSSIATGATVHSAISNQKGEHTFHQGGIKKERQVMWREEGVGPQWVRHKGTRGIFKRTKWTHPDKTDEDKKVKKTWND